MSRSLSLSFVALVVVAACAAPAANPTVPPATAAPTVVESKPPATAAVTPAPTPVPTPAAPATPSAFASVVYDYGLTLPAGWSAVAAIFSVDDSTYIGHDALEVDKYGGPGSEYAFSWSVPFSGDLSELVQVTIEQTVRDHSDTCPTPQPEVTEPIKVGGQPGMFLAWNCGILINMATTVRQGTAFTLILGDPAIASATDTRDRALLEELLDSVVFPT